jgi:hypothetical protein
MYQKTTKTEQNRRRDRSGETDRSMVMMTTTNYPSNMQELQKLWEMWNCSDCSRHT